MNCWNNLNVRLKPGNELQCLQVRWKSDKERILLPLALQLHFGPWVPPLIAVIASSHIFLVNVGCDKPWREKANLEKTGKVLLFAWRSTTSARTVAPRTDVENVVVGTTPVFASRTLWEIQGVAFSPVTTTMMCTDNTMAVLHQTARTSAYNPTSSQPIVEVWVLLDGSLVPRHLRGRRECLVHTVCACA